MFRYDGSDIKAKIETTAVFFLQILMSVLQERTTVLSTVTVLTQLVATSVPASVDIQTREWDIYVAVRFIPFSSCVLE